MEKAYQLIRTDEQGNMKVLSVSNSKSYINKRMEKDWQKELESARRNFPGIQRCFFVGEYAKIWGVAERSIKTIE